MIRLTRELVEAVLVTWREEAERTVDTAGVIPVPEDALRALIAERDELRERLNALLGIFPPPPPPKSN